MNCADIFVLPTLHEGCCNAIIEAMACGLPIVSSDRDFNHDILDETCSILIDPTNTKEIAKAIKTLKENKSLRDKLSQGAIDKSQTLTIDRRAKKIIDFINQRSNR